MQSVFGSIDRGKDQYYQPGYALDWFPVRLTPGEGDPAVTLDDDWHIRIIYSDAEPDTFVKPRKTLVGDTLILTHEFTPSDTAKFSDFPDLKLVVEYGPSARVKPRMMHRLIEDPKLDEPRRVR